MSEGLYVKIRVPPAAQQMPATLAPSSTPRSLPHSEAGQKLSGAPLGCHRHVGQIGS